jgi:hypothetical protein
MPLDAERQGLETLQEEERIPGGEGRPQVAQQLDTQFQDEREVAERLGVHQSMV